MLKTTPCPHFYDCGGCDFLDLEEAEYRKTKQEILKKIIASSPLLQPSSLSERRKVEDIVRFNADQNSRDPRSLTRSRMTTGESMMMAEDIDWIWVGPESRRKVIFQIDQKNILGFFAKKSQQVVEINSCYIAEKEISDIIPELKKFLKSQEQNLFTQISVTLFDNGLDLVFVAKRELNSSQILKLTNFGKEQNLNISHRIKNDVTPVFLIRKNLISYADFNLELRSEIFIQATKQGLEAITKIITSSIKDLANNTHSLPKITDIYAGFGAYTFAIHNLAKSITAFEGDKKMVDLINKNAAANSLGLKIKAETRDLFNYPISTTELKLFDIVIINPPRNGASPQIIEIAKSKNLRQIIYVSCNPQSFFRDSKILNESGFILSKLTALDQFYSTSHLELVGVFTAS